MDLESRLDARYYEPTSGRFLSADPIGQASSVSLYDFAKGDPINFFDPTGRVNLELIQPNTKAMAGDRYYNPTGVYSISAHGNPSSVDEFVSLSGGGFPASISPSYLAGLIGVNGYTAGTPVVLLSCRTGAIGSYVYGDTANYANQLSQQLTQQYGVASVVVAPQGPVYANPNTGRQESGLVDSWHPNYTNVSQNYAYWNVYYNGTPEVPLSNDAVNSPDFAAYINASIALGESLRILDEVQQIYNSIYGNGPPVHSNCPLKSQ